MKLDIMQIFKKKLMKTTEKSSRIDLSNTIHIKCLLEMYIEEIRRVSIINSIPQIIKTNMSDAVNYVYDHDEIVWKDFEEKCPIVAEYMLGMKKAADKKDGIS